MFLAPYVESSPRDDLPLECPVNYQTFKKYKDPWAYWRALGHFDGNGSFVAPVSFEEAKQMPRSEIDFYLDMDNLLLRMKRHRAKQKGKPK